MKFRDKNTGAIYAPSDAVAAMMAANPNLERVDEGKKPTKTSTRSTKAAKTE